MKKTVLALVAAALILSAPLSAQQTAPILVDQIQVLLDQLKSLVAPPPPPVVAIQTASGLSAALAAAAPGAVITVSPQLVYTTPLNIVAPVTIQVEGLRAGRMDATTPLPLFMDGLVVTSSGVTLRGLEVKKNYHLSEIASIKGGNVTLDRMRILGDPVEGARRCLIANGNGNVSIINSYLDYCFGTYPGNDTQAIIAWDMAPGLLIENNLLVGGSETIMFGGADASSPARDPRDITIRGNDITKRPEWQAQLVGVKNTLELKNAHDVLIEGNNISQSWGGHGQDGFLLTFTVRNQSGGDPTANVENVLVQNNHVFSGAGAVQILGTDNNWPSGKMNNVVFKNNLFDDIDANKYTGTLKVVQIGGTSTGVEFRDNTFAQSVGSTASIYFYGSVPTNIHDAMVLVNNILPRTKYGVFGEGSSVNLSVSAPTPAWLRYVTNGVWSGNTLVPVQ